MHWALKRFGCSKSAKQQPAVPLMGCKQWQDPSLLFDAI
jgi:hypothetical protein